MTLNNKFRTIKPRKCIAVIHRLNDDDDKLIIVPNNKTYTDNEIRLLTDFQEKYYESMIVR